jgi:hypothetical protein
MRTLLPLSLAALSLCAGCTAPDGLQATFAQAQNCVVPSTQVSLAPMPCARPTWPPPGTVFTHPNGNGPQVELWGPPAWSGGGGAG